MPLDAASLERLGGIVDAACADQKAGIPGASVVVVGKDGEELFAHSAGKRGVATSEPMTLDSVFWIASCTKLLTGIACMQLVEEGVLQLDDGDQVEKLLPELRDVQVLLPDGSLVAKKNKITLRMLLTHTAGFGYTFFNERLRDWSYPAGVDEFSGRFEDIKMPLLFQPGEGWEYGVGIDWAGVALERASGLTLNDFLQERVFTPLGITDMSMIPNSDMRCRMAYMHQRDADGILRPRDHLLRVPLVIDPENSAEVGALFNSGGAGMFARPRDYCKVLAVLLNDGRCPRTGTRILGEAMIDEMFRNQVAAFPDFGRQGLAAAKPDLTLPADDLYPLADGAPQGWGITFMQANGTATGRSKGAVHWAGLANLWWWVDRDKGIAGMVATQILPFGDSKVLGLWGEVEAAVYEAKR